MDLELLAALRTREGVEALAAATSVADLGPLAAASALRARGIAPALAAAALTQADLRRRAVGKFGADAQRMFFTRAGLEQATRGAVARRRAERLVAAGVTALVDLGCGIGADTIAAARAGITVTAIDADPLTAAIAATNAEILGLAAHVAPGPSAIRGDTTAHGNSIARTDAGQRTGTIVQGSARISQGSARISQGRAEDMDLSMVEAAFCDPARRRGNSRVFDPAAFSPSWDFVTHLVRTVPHTVLKLAPGIDHALIPDGAEAEWVSVDGDVVEAAFWCGPLASVARRATLFRAETFLELTGDGATEAPVGPMRRFVYDPDGAVVRSHLVASLAAVVNGTLADPTIAYVYADAFSPTPFGRCYEISETMPFSLKRLRTVLRERGIGRLTIKKRGSALEPEQLRRDLRLSGTGELTIILTRVAGAPTVLLCQPIT